MRPGGAAYDLPVHPVPPVTPESARAGIRDTGRGAPDLPGAARGALRAEQISGILLTLLVIASQLVAVITGDHRVAAGIGAVCAVVCAVSLWTAAGTPRARASSRAGAVLEAGVAVTLLASAAVAFPAQLVTLPAMVLGVVRVVRMARPRVAVMVLLAVAVVLVVTGWSSPVSTGDAITCVLSLGGSALFAALGRQVRATRERDREVLAQQVQIQSERAENAALLERARIARDLHDVLAHSLGALGLQLEAAQMLSEAGRHDEARARVARARDLAADGLRESRDVVAALRATTTEEPEAAVDRLVEAHREAGGVVTLPRADPSADPVAGPATDVEPGWSVGLFPSAAETCVRAVQELLTNARRHAPGASVDLDLHRRDDEVTITCTDTAPGSVTNAEGGGAGLRGMRERCVALGGWMRISPTDDGRFRVVVHVPVGGQEPPDGDRPARTTPDGARPGRMAP